MIAALLAAALQPQDIVVTGSALPDAPGDAAYASVDIGRERLTGAASNRLEDILRDVPGLQLFRRSDSRSANPTSQGVTLRALGGNASSRALLTLDGVPQSDPFGGWVNWPAYRPERLGGVRVTRGGGSGADGPGAIAGTIALRSAIPSDLDGLSAGAAYGSRDSIDAFAAYGGAVGEGFASFGASYATGDGFIPVVAEDRGPADRAARYDQASLAARGVAPIGGATELQASALLFRDARDRGLDFTNSRTKGADASLRLVGSGDLPWSALAYVQTRDYYNSFASTTPGRTAATQVSEQYTVPSTGIGARGEIRPRIGAVELRIGGDARRTTGETRERYNFQNGSATRLREAGGATTTIGAFAEATIETDAWTLTGGARIDRWRISDGRLEERPVAGGAAFTDTDFVDRSGWEPTARAGAVFHAAPSVDLRAAAYLGWRLPTLNELYRPFRVGPDAVAANDALAPERLRGIEAGAEWRPAEGACVGVTLFANRLDNAIANVTLGTGPGTFPGVGFVAAGGTYSQRRNLDAIVSRGIEADAGIRRGDWSLTAGYAFADAEVRADAPAAALDGLRPAQTPRHSVSATIGWTRDRAAASLTTRYTAAQFEDDLNRQRISSALTFDAAAAVPLTGGLALEARAENIGDRRVVAGIAGDGTVERATPRTLWIGFKWRG
ncbi:TonB-dependent receptor [Allosphingosinicella indica]|uniref:Outer membrane cobalamin receptor protein n=1 Tax=Allosphingosinicella indica TaxID=941907 RepID=A0A1X7G918_9SPHN|nr:TonB-dependent receptor [Allosphingosinicella indica]SMF66148.1 Outer membrane cobalamin receptor protein [Allosphingosinicella indica]